jgi:hypothetical protein
VTVVVVEQDALDRLAQLSVSVEQMSKVVLRADAEAKLCTDLDPPNMEGMIRYGRTARYLREELLPLGWDYDNSAGYCRTIHPSREFAVVASSGDKNTGLPQLSPSTKYPKGETTARAVEANGQLSLDFGEDFDLDEPTFPAGKTWYLLYRVTADEIFVELSLPTAIDSGVISDWDERIILPPVPRHQPPTIDEPAGADEEGYSVPVALR